jgi:hypothetical protein
MSRTTIIYKKVARKESDLTALNAIIYSRSSLLYTSQHMMNQPQCKRKHEYGPFQLIEQCPGHAWKSVSAKDRCKITTDSQIEEWQEPWGKNRGKYISL